MKFYISASGIKRVTIPSSAPAGGGGGGGGGGMKGGKGSAGAGGGGTRRIYHRTVLLPVVLMLGLLLPFLFVRIAFLVLESASFCSSSIGNFSPRTRGFLVISHSYITSKYGKFEFICLG